MSAKHLTPAMVARTVAVIDGSGILDLACPPRRPGEVGRIGLVRENTRLLFIGIHLATRLGHETTVRGAHQVLTEALSRDLQWELGVLRPLTTRADAKIRGARLDPDASTLTENGKHRKHRWTEVGVEQVSYDNLHKATTALRKRLDYGYGSAPDLDEADRATRRVIVAAITDALIDATTIPRTGSTFAIDATGQWAWTRGSGTGKAKAEQALRKELKEQAGVGQDKDEETGLLEVADIALDEGEDTPPTAPDKPAPAGAQGRCLDAAWGYKTSKTGEKEVGFGFHQHTVVRTPDPDADRDSEPILVDGFALTPANADVVAESLDTIDRIRAKHRFTTLLGDLLYTNLKATRWAVRLAERGIEQGLSMRKDNHGVLDVRGAQMQHSWLHCAAAPMHLRPIPPEWPTPQEWEALHEQVEAFQRTWAFDRKESGLHRRTSKWVCPARAGRVGCHALGKDSAQAAIDLGLPVINPPTDWQTRESCTRKTIDVTPDPADPSHQRKLAQRHYYGSRAWRRLIARRSRVEGVFGILKNPSRQRLRRGQNRLPGLAMATIIAAIKISVFNEEQLRAWHQRTGAGPAGHYLLQPDPPYHGFRDLTKNEAEAIDAANLRRLHKQAREATGGDADPAQPQQDAA